MTSAGRDRHLHHLGCIPIAHEGNYDGSSAPPRLAIRLLGSYPPGPAPANLPVPPYTFVPIPKSRSAKASDARPGP